MAIYVHKFGGASLATADNIRNIEAIIRDKVKSNAVIVVSAMGKMTNALEQVVHAIYQEQSWEDELEIVRSFHCNIAAQLFTDPSHINDLINDILVEIEWIAAEVNDNYDYIYDQIVSIGELLSSAIVEQYLKWQGIDICLIDARDIISTDQSYRKANIDWDLTEQRITNLLPSKFEQYDYIITQGFIGIDDENNTTTLGREGSDFTASIIAKCIKSESVTVWKDVPGIMSADPKKYSFAEKIDHLSYGALYAMADAGAKVIHPKTILPLKESNIPLIVNSYIDQHAEGTMITNAESEELPAIVTCLNDQRYIQLTPSKFSSKLTEWSILSLFEEQKLDITFFQKHALSYSICVRDEFKLESILKTLESDFSIESETGLSLITILYSSKAIREQLTKSNTILMEQLSDDVYRCIMS